ncbi:MAG: SDR family oxidoreductase [Prolixibacteraceae bacterium]|nr:SDR family oxidoreductase [Prolixibacteraceae bacterium]
MNKYCLITGAASGLGRAFAFKFFKCGYNLVLVDKDAENLELVKNEILDKGSLSVYTIYKDLSVDGSAKEIFDEVNSLKISVDILINNAGFGIFGFFHETSEERFSDLIRLSVVTTSQLTRLFLPDMVKKGEGKIMLVSSLAAFQPAPIMSVYAASKVYLLYLGEALSNELKNTGVSVTVLCPGMVATNFQEVTGNKKPEISWNIFSAEKVADYGFNALMKEKSVAIPGFASRIMAQLHRLFPRKTAACLVRKIHEKNRAK